MDNAVLILTVLLGGCAALMLLGGILEFARWLVTRSLAALQDSIYSLGRMIATGSMAVAWLLKAMAKRIALWTQAALRRAVAPLRACVHRMAKVVRDGFEASGDTDSRSEEPRWGDRDADPHEEPWGNDKTSTAHGRVAYDDALALLGLTDTKPLNSTILRQRYAEMIRIVHPDKGFPNQAFAQQLNAAVYVIRKAQGWI